MNIKLDHINLTVASLREAIDWYQKVFGFKLVESGESPQGTRWGIVAANDSMICMTEYPMRALAGKSAGSSNHRIYHFGIRISDIAAWRRIVAELHLKLNYGGEVEYPFSTSWYVQDPSGHEIEVSYTADEHLRFPIDRAYYSSSS
jgi:catechol 2,3-dioxygenase-like lactoylglutathione lyase family enzyme